jgi:DNA-binding MarR family transcriptional regulator
MVKATKKTRKSAQLRISAQKRISALPRSVAIKDKDYLVLASFRRSLRNFLNFSEQAAQNRGLTPKQHQAILAIRGFDEAGGVTVGDLAEHLHLKHHTAVELVDRLVRAKLVVRKTDREDRRRVLLNLTAKAHTALKALSGIHMAEIRRNAPGMIKLLKQLS